MRRVQCSFQDYLLMVVQEKKNRPNHRMGQCYSNVLRKLKPSMENYIRTSKMLDCFYDDSKIGAFLYEVCTTWEDHSE